LISVEDDGIVVGMTLDDYLSGPEEMRRRELVWGVVREPPSPYVPHQRLIVRISALLDAHVRERNLGTVLIAPMDVILDDARGLVVQPDVMFISRARDHIIREFVWGAPDLVVEVASRSTLAYDFTTKLAWYERYGARECWFVDFAPRAVTVVTFDGRGGRIENTARGTDRIPSAVLPEFAGTVELFFD
jgi:Uma2 family endonuclease